MIEVAALESYLVGLLKTNDYSGYEPEVLLEAFRTLDKEKNGYLDLYMLYSFLKTYGDPFSKDQREDMDKFVKDNESDLVDLPRVNNDDNDNKAKTTTQRKFYYENYVKKVFEDNERHFQDLMEEYEAYKNEFLQTHVYKELPSLISKEALEKMAKEEEERKKAEEEKAKAKEEKKEGDR
ncbi:MAG: hypothetical protein MJ252_07760 [archaeon]|nr:hypothetical protein [archaeon]